MPTMACKICGKAFYAKPFFLKNGWAKYCSFTCHHEGLKKGKLVKCDVCGKESYKSRAKLKNSKSKKYFCGKSCQTKWRNSEFIGPKHANWTTGRHSYKSVLKRHKIAPICKKCGTIDKRVLAVHHIDENRNNNKLSNLTWLCHNCHFLVHHYDDEKRVLMVPIV